MEFFAKMLIRDIRKLEGIEYKGHYESQIKITWEVILYVN